MGFYAYIGRPRGSGEVAGDDIAELLDQQEDWDKLRYKDPNRGEEWYSPWGIARLVRDKPDKEFDGAYFWCRFSWATDGNELSDAITQLVALADQLGMIVMVEGQQEQVTKENLSEFVRKFFRASETVKETLGTVAHDDRTEADSMGTASPRSSAHAFKVNPEKILERDFELLDQVAYLFCTRCGSHIAVLDKFKRKAEKMIGKKLEKNNQYFQADGCLVFCLRKDQKDIPNEDMTIEEVPLS